MHIANYDNRAIDLKELESIGESNAFIAGAYDGFYGHQEHRPKKPHKRILVIKKISKSHVGVYATTTQCDNDFTRLKGKWDTDRKCWLFPTHRIETLKSDNELNAKGDLWSGIPEEEEDRTQEAMVKYEQDMHDYGEGYQFGQEEICRQRIRPVRR